jgi:hypothetical protein
MTDAERWWPRNKGGGVWMAEFINAIREVIGLGPIPNMCGNGPDTCRVCLRCGSRCPRHYDPVGRYLESRRRAREVA